MLSSLTDWSIQTVAVANAILAWVAGMVHSWAATRVIGWLRRMFMFIAFLAFFYSLAYWWLFINPDRGGEWSAFLRPFGIVTWVIAWGIEPILLVKYLENRGKELEQMAKYRISRARLEHGINLDGDPDVD